MKLIKVGIIGCGKIFPMHAISIQKQNNVQIIAICDIKQDRLKKAVELYGCKGYTNYKEMINQSDLDVVHLCTPHYLHHDMAIYALNHGIHVVTEKPIALTYSDALEMYEASKNNNKHLIISFQNRFNNGSLLIKETLISGKLGRILSAKCCVTWNRPDTYYSQSDWKGTWDKEGGGVIIDQAIHTLDLMHWFIDSPIKQIDATLHNRTHHLIDVEDSAEGTIHYECGILATFYAINYYAYDAPIFIELYCEKGIATMVGEKAHICLNNGHELIADRDPNEQFNFGDVKQYWGVGHMRFISAIYNCLNSGKTPPNLCKDFLSTHKMIMDIYDVGRW